MFRTEELSETCRVSCQNKFVKLVHLFGFIIKKFVTMHGHMNVNFAETCSSLCMSHILYHEVHLVDDILMEYTAVRVTLPGKHITGYKCLQ